MGTVADPGFWNGERHCGQPMVLTLTSLENFEGEGGGGAIETFFIMLRLGICVAQN